MTHNLSAGDIRKLLDEMNAKDNEIATLRELVQAKRAEIARLQQIIRGEPKQFKSPLPEVDDE